MTTIAALFNPFAPNFTEQRYLLLARLREESPVCYLPALGFWAVTRHEDIKAIVSDPSAFPSAGAYSSSNNLSAEAKAIYNEDMPLYKYSLVNTDKPLHTRLRAPIAAAFVPRRIRELQDEIGDDVKLLLGQLFDAAPVADFVTGFAKPLPIRTIVRLLGLPLEDVPKIHGFSNAFTALLIPTLPVEAQVQAVKGLKAFDEYMRDFVTGANTNLSEGLLSNMLAARSRGEHDLSDDELVGNLANVLFAGHETTVNTLANSFVRLLNDRPTWSALVDGTADVDALTDELLRLDTAGVGLYRKTAAVTRFGDVEVPAGATLWIAFGSANRDASVFPEPDKLDPNRENLREQLTFGYGLHYCIGVALARTQIRAAISTAATMYPHLKQVGVAPELPNHTLRATLALPVSA
jgi:cytochrome P450